MGFKIDEFLTRLLLSYKLHQKCLYVDTFIYVELHMICTRAVCACIHVLACISCQDTLQYNYRYHHICMYVCLFMYVCMYVCMYVYMYVCMCMYVCMYVCMYAHMHLCMYVCMYVCRVKRGKWNVG